MTEFAAPSCSSGPSVNVQPEDLRLSPLGSWLSNDRWAWPVVPVWPLLHETYLRVATATRSATKSPDEAREAGFTFVRSIATDIAQLTSRAVAQEVANDAAGDPVADWPAAIATRYQDRYSVTEFLSGHPALHERVQHVLALHLTSLQRMLTRLQDDADDVQALCATPSIRLRKAIASGDLHRRGSVLMVEFSSGVRVMYKPRGLSIETGLSPLLRHLASSDADVQVALPVSIDRHDYGWQRYVRSEPLDENSTAEAFYRSMGGLVTLAHLLGGVDLHCDNLVCVGSVPTILDPECFFHVAAGPEVTADPRRRSTAGSIVATGLIPYPELPAGVPDTTTLGSFGGRQARQQRALPVTAADGNMRLRTYRFPPFLPPQLPFRHGQSIPAAGYEASLVDGFRRTYLHFMTCGECRRFVLRLPITIGTARVRHLVRPTAAYAKVLHALSDRRAAKSSQQADDYARRLLSGTRVGASDDTLAAELVALRAGYVPLFERQANGRLVTTDSGSPLTVLPVSGIDLAIGRMEGLSEEDMEHHVAVLSRSLATLRDASRQGGS